MIDYAELRELIPHAHPILLVDKVLDISPPDRITTAKTVTGSEPCYAGIAPGAPTRAFAYPPALLMESWGQGGALLWMRHVRSQARERNGGLILAAARDMEFRRPVYPGDTLRHEVRIDQFVGDNVIMSGESYVDDELVSKVDYAIPVMRPSDELTWAS